MAKTSYIQIAPELEDKFYKNVQTMDRFIIPRIKPKNALLSRKRKQAIEDRTYLKTCSQLWNALTPSEQQDWKDVDPYPNPNGYRAFVADQSIRIKSELAGTTAPNQYHQDMVGKIEIESPAEETELIQQHPSSYYVYQKVAGKKEMYEPVEVEESFALPLEIGISYKSDLTSTGDGSFARFYAKVRHLYQGQNLDYDLIIDIPLISNWNRQTLILYQPHYYGLRGYGRINYGQEFLGEAISYNLYIHLYKIRGTLLIDNVKAEHSGSNWARDSFCKEIDRTFSRQFSQILDHWEALTLPAGANFSSIYPT